MAAEVLVRLGREFTSVRRQVIMLLPANSGRARLPSAMAATSPRPVAHQPAQGVPRRTPSRGKPCPTGYAPKKAVPLQEARRRSRPGR